MANYVNITQSEIEEFLNPQGFKEIKLPNISEKTYGKRVFQDDLQLTLRIYTGIVHGNSREVGKDAIRVVLFLRLNDGKIIKLSGSKRVNRVRGWKKNLQDRIDNWIQDFPIHKCECGCPMFVRKGKNGKFYGCSNYPSCKKTKNFS